MNRWNYLKNCALLITATSLLSACGGAGDTATSVPQPTAQDVEAASALVLSNLPADQNTQTISFDTPTDTAGAGSGDTSTQPSTQPSDQGTVLVGTVAPEDTNGSGNTSTPPTPSTPPVSTDTPTQTTPPPPVVTTPPPPPPAAETTVAVSGGAVKGPMAFANVTLYRLDTAFPDFYDAQAPLSNAFTNARAEIEGLEVPGSTAAPLVMVFDGASAVDLNTNAAPVITQLITVVTPGMLGAGRAVYATPLTTLAFHMARLEAGVGASASEVENALAGAAAKISETVGFGTPSAVDIMTTPAIVNAETTTADAQQRVAEHRAAIESVSALLYEMSSPVGDGLKAEYYDNMDLTNLTLSRIDASVNFDWQNDAPRPGVGAETFSVRWTGYVEPENSETYTFYTLSDDGVRLWVDDQLLIDNWTNHAVTEDSATIALLAGQKYTVKLEYFDNTRLATMGLLWSSPSQAKEIIPQSRLYSSNVPATIDTNELLSRLARDLQSDGVIDNADNGAIIGGINTTVMAQDLGAMLVPNTSVLIKDIASLIEEENSIMGIGVTLYSNQMNAGLSLATLSLGGGQSGVASPGIDLSGSGGTSTAPAAPAPSPEPPQVVVTDPPPVDTGSSGGGTSSGSTGQDAQVVVTDPLVDTTPPPSTEPSPVIGVDTQSLISSGPIVISGESGTVISGLHITNPNGTCLDIKNGASNIIIENSEIGPCKRNGIYIKQSSRITIRGVYIHNTKDNAVVVTQSSNVDVTQSTINDVMTGVYAVESEAINVSNNSFLNMQGPYPRGQFVQFNNVTGPGLRINNNTGINELGSSFAEDAINLYKSSGTPADPMQINGNVIVGGGPSASGGGILVGDNGGSNTIMRNNILVNPGQYGMAVTGGRNHIVENNLIFGKQQSFTNVGLYIWDQHNSNCGNITIRGNQVNWTNKAGSKNGVWNKGNCGTITGWSDNDWNANIDASIAN
ncbi:MAG: hypothetical protein GXP10_00765 [Gammaproteobacteria bacterium]|nr:hypothetical protein [Gammaproteobacteria bacterium]